ncbi:g-patch domain-containing protein [Phthorimaea operculella]|nr:g-patch domain-containing protein [Phthorimaea operculella]
MDFARKQLEKYGWTDGKGLGKNENGISEPIKAKLKRSVAGIGHDQAAELTDQWWNKLYDKAAKNVEVEEKNGKTKKIKTKDNNFQITNSSYHLNKSDSKKTNPDEEYSDFFIKKAVLTNEGGGEKKIRESDSDSDVEEKKDVFQMTDEELFAACEGRTAHKGARHGLRALGKLARIEQQEQMLLADQKYTVLEENDAEMAENCDEGSVNSTKRKSSDNEESETVSKNKKKKHIQDDTMETESAEVEENKPKKNKKKKKNKDE